MTVNSRDAMMLSGIGGARRVSGAPSSSSAVLRKHQTVAGESVSRIDCPSLLDQRDGCQNTLQLRAGTRLQIS